MKSFIAWWVTMATALLVLGVARGAFGWSPLSWQGIAAAVATGGSGYLWCRDRYAT